MRRAAKTDSNQQAIVDRLREIGARVYYIKEPVDLLIAYRKRFIAMEVKTPEGRLTAQQVKFIAECDGPVLVARDPEEAVNLVLKECA